MTTFTIDTLDSAPAESKEQFESIQLACRAYPKSLRRAGRKP